jgi:pyruvate formate lyase activating enzyme
MSEGQRGLCYVRGVQDSEVVLHTYGRSSGFCVDPIEKKPLNHFLPGTPILSFGTAGCNLSCKFCQNWDISKSRQMDTLQSEASPQAIVKAAKDAGCKSIAFTYNDPIIFLEYAKDVATEAHRHGLKTVAVTGGFINEEPRQEFFSFIDAANVDLKAFTEDFYQKICAGHLDNVLETLKYIKNETKVWLEITTLLIPGKNDSDEELNNMCQWIVENLGTDVPHHFTAFHPDWKMPDIPATPHSSLTRARNIAKSHGLKYVYIGNVHDPLGSSTYCHECGEQLIERDWYQLGTWNLEADAKCKSCGTRCAGHFEPEAGTWGARRLPLSI